MNRDVEDKFLRNVTKWKKPRPRVNGELIGSILDKFVETNLKPLEKKASPIVEAWNNVVPEGFREHCRLDKIQRGVVWVIVDSSAFVFNLQMLKQELISSLEEQCKRVKIKDIKFRVGTV